MNIGIIGIGKMGSSILKGILKTGMNVKIYDIVKERAIQFKNRKIKISKSLKEIYKESDLIVLAVKPKDIPFALEDIRFLKSGAVILSIAAGVRCADLKKLIVRDDIKVIRAMPNLPLSIGKGVCGIFIPDQIDKRSKTSIIDIFKQLSQVYVFNEEVLLDAITALAGSGPGFIAVILEAFADGGVKLGLTREVALDISARILIGTAELFLKEKLHPALIKDMVSSPGGTTISGLEVLEKNGIRGTIIKAIVEAGKRAKEISEGK